MTSKQTVSELRRVVEQLESFDGVTFDNVIAIYSVLEKLDPGRVYDPKNPNNQNKESKRFLNELFPSF